MTEGSTLPAYEVSRNELDKFIGMTVYGRPEIYIDSGATFKFTPTSFKVFEVGDDGSIATPLNDTEGEYVCKRRESVRYVLCKVGVSTKDAVDALTRATGARVGYAGLKDVNAFTCQYVTIKCRPGLRLRKKYILLDGAARFYFKDVRQFMIKRGDLEGNVFEVTIDGIGSVEEGTLRRVLQVVSTAPFPNFYGYQRFGFRRPVSHIIGQKLLEGDYRGAVDALLAPTVIDNESRRVLRARKAYARGDLRESYTLFPKSFHLERRVLRAIMRGKSLREALLVLGPWYLRFFVEAYQAYLFNLALSKAIAYSDGLDNLVSVCEVFPLPKPGLRKDMCTRYVVSVMKEANFRAISEFRKFLRSGARETYFNVRDISWEVVGERLLMRFILRPATYASVLLREFLRDGLKLV